MEEYADIYEIIIKYIFDKEEKKELLKLFEENWHKHLAVELDRIKHRVTKKEKEIIEDYFSRAF